MPPSPTALSPLLARRWPPRLAILAAVVLAYCASLRAPFLFDDTGAVVENPTIRRLFSLDALTPPKDGSTTTGRPIINLSYALNYAISGDAVWSYHALNLAIHALAALTLFGVLRRTLSLNSARFSPSHPAAPNASAHSIAFFSALLWAVHPLLTESVVCIAQRTESLGGLIYLFTLYAFIRATSPSAEPNPVCHPLGDKLPHPRWAVVCVVSCLVGMATKEIMVTAPVLLLLYDRTFLTGTFAASLRQRRATYAALASTWLLLAWLLLRGGGSRGVAAGFGLGVSGWDYLLKQSEALVLYLKLSLWPHPLVLDYGTAVAHSLTEVWWQGPCILVLLAATVWALVRRPVLGFAGAWFFVILAPSSSFVPLVTQTIAEHRMYLPLAAVLVVLVAWLHRALPARATTLGVALATAAALATFARTLDYREVTTIWADTVQKQPRSARAHNNLAWALQRSGHPDLANPHFTRAVELEPSYVAARYNWGVALLDQGRTADAIVQFETAVRLAPLHPDAHLNLGNALMQVGRAADAVPHYEEALRLSPGADAHFDLGVALVETSRFAEALPHLGAALGLRPTLFEAHFQIGRAAEGLGRTADAERAYTEVLRFVPDHLLAHRRLGLLLARSDRLPAAAEHFRAVLRLAPTDPDAHANLGNVLLLQGNAREAIPHYEASLRLRPNDPRTRESLQLARESLR